MGISIDLHVYPRATLERDIEKFVVQEGGFREGAVPPERFLSLVGNHFGELTADEFYVIWNEYYEDYNPASNFLQAVQQYYFPDREPHAVADEEYKQRTGREYYDDFYPNNYQTYSGGANADEVLGEVFEDEFGYEGKFSRNEDY